MVKSLYIHIPFCRNICSYCDFCKMFYNATLVNKYLDELANEISKNYNNEILDTIYIGGGTPSCLNNDELEKLFSITDRLRKNMDTEFSIECNFDSITKEKIDLLLRHGINRISFGLETTSEKQLKRLNRELDKDNVKDIIDYCHDKNLNNINIDLIYALNNQTINDLKDDLDFIISLDVSHISTYSLIIENNTVLAINNEKNISQDLDYKMFKFICDYLKKLNYNHYEISNFSRDGYYSKHNTCYWNNDEYYGFGLGASSFIGNKRIENTRSITKYLNKNYVKEIEVLDMRDMMEYEILLNLRKNTGIDLRLFEKKYHIQLKDIYNYDELTKQGLLYEVDDHLLIPEDKWYISNEIIVKILGSEIDE